MALLSFRIRRILNEDELVEVAATLGLKLHLLKFEQLGFAKQVKRNVLTNLPCNTQKTNLYIAHFYIFMQHTLICLFDIYRANNLDILIGMSGAGLNNGML